jgi:histidyl-tRNA synthetase
METLNLNTELLRGFRYLFGQDLAVTKQVIRVCEGVLEQANFEEIMTPTLLDYSAVVGEADRPIGSKRGSVFDLLTVDGEKLALRYENTLPVSLFFLHNFSGSPSVTRRFFYVSSHFRNEETTSAHRLREFRQVGYELLGGQSEVNLPVSIETGSMLLTALGLSHSVRVSDVRILSTIFHQLGISKADRSALRSLFDSGDKQAFESFLAPSSMTASQKALLARLALWKDSSLTETGELIDFLLTHGLEAAVPQVARIIDVLMRLPESVRQLAAIDLTLVRDASMYSGIIYQYYLLEGGDHEIGGGGEYNTIIKSLGGPDVMACGAAFGLERIIHAYNARRTPAS